MFDWNEPIIITHILVENEASVRNLTRQLSKALHDIKQNNISTTQELRNQTMELEMLRQQLEKINNTATKSIFSLRYTWYERTYRKYV